MGLASTLCTQSSYTFDWYDVQQHLDWRIPVGPLQGSSNFMVCQKKYHTGANRERRVSIFAIASECPPCKVEHSSCMVGDLTRECGPLGDVKTYLVLGLTSRW